MSIVLSKKQMTEEDIKLNYITPAILKGWKGHITMETRITDGRINIRGNIVVRSKPKFVDYLLYLNDGKPIAVVEAKDNNHSVSHGLQQAMTYVASLNIMNAKILFSKSNLLVSKLFEPGTDGNRKSLEKHHLFPKAYLKSQGYSDAKINQMANYAFIDWKDNMDILDDAPSVYYPIVCAGLSDEQIRVMEEENALPHGWENMDYEDFLIERRKLMAAKIKAAFEILKKAAT